MAPLLFALFPASQDAPPQDVSERLVPAFSAEKADVRETLRRLFQSVGGLYTIAPDVQGTVDVALRNVTFETALQNVLRQVEATYRIESDVYQIVLRGDEATPYFPEQADLDRAYVRLGDLARKAKALATWLGPRFVFFAGKAMRQGSAAAQALAESERAGARRNAWVERIEPPPGRQVPGVDRYATVEAQYVRGAAFTDTWRRPAQGGEWRLLARRAR